LDYVVCLLEKKRDDTSDQKIPIESAKEFEKNFKYLTVKKPKNSFPFKILKKIYHPDPTFRFTSRYCNTITVGLVALYYIFLYWTYTVSMAASQWVAYIPNTVDSEGLSINLGQLICQYVPDTCLPSLEDSGAISMPLPGKIINFYPSIKSSILAVIIVPLFVAALLCVIQVFFLIRETKTHLIEMYKGKCEFVRKAGSLTNQSIASSSFHFGGYFLAIIFCFFLEN